MTRHTKQWVACLAALVLSWGGIALTAQTVVVGLWGSSGGNTYLPSGNLGIGTTTPASPLTVWGAPGDIVQISTFTAAGTNDIMFYNGSGGSPLLRIGSSAGAGESWIDSYASIHFGTNTPTFASGERWRMDTTGNLIAESGKGQHIDMQAANNDVSGTCTFAATTCTVTFTTAFTVPPSCTANDQTAAAPIKAAPAVGSLVLTGGTGAGTTDVVGYHCIGNPN